MDETLRQILMELIRVSTELDQARREIEVLRGLIPPPTLAPEPPQDSVPNDQKSE